MLHGGAQWTRHNLSDGTLIHLSSLSPEACRTIMEAHDKSIDSGTWLKSDPKRNTTRVTSNNDNFIVKKYLHLHALHCVSADVLGWCGSNRLQGTPRCHAWFRRRDDKAAYLIFDDAGDRDLFLENGLFLPPEQTAELFAHAGAIIASLHNQNAYHADTKPSNFVTSTSNPRSLNLIDCDDVRVFFHISTRHCAKNIAQFIGCLWNIQDWNLRSTFTRAFWDGYTTHRQARITQDFHKLTAASLTRLYPEQQSINNKLPALLQS